MQSTPPDSPQLVDLSPPDESHYKNLAEQYERQDGGHSLDRHGPELTVTDHERRLRTGMARDNKYSPAKASTNFRDYETWVKTREAAMKAVELLHNIDLSRPPQPSAPTAYPPVVVEFDKPVDDGLVGDDSQPTHPIYHPTNPNARPGVGFMAFLPVSGITRTTTRVVWDNQALKWIVKQHFPQTKGWNNATQTYDPSSPADMGMQLK